MTTVKLIITLALCSFIALFSHSSEASEPNCAADSRITEVFDNGASWDFCWESRIRENLVLSDVHYTPPNGEPLKVLSSARLSQLHVAYDDSDVTYNDVTQFGLGGGYLLSLTPQDCPQGTLLTVQTRTALCLWRTEADTGYSTASRNDKTQSLNLFSVSQVGAYAYIVSWTFYANGAMEPGVGATGALQRSSENTELPFGRVLQGDPDTLWLSHTHNYYWRLDFDLGQSATDDVFAETRYALAADGTRSRQVEIYATEQARQIDPEQQAVWEIRDNAEPDSAAYLIEPVRSGHHFQRGDIEPYSEYDFFVTVANDCERFASQNARFNPDCLNNVLQYVDGQSIENQDLVMWHRVSFHHVPRSEDQRHMHTHWDGFVMEPRNILDGTSSLLGQANTAPVFDALTDKNTIIGNSVHDHISASDPDGDVLSFTAISLPPGLSMNSQGHIHGEPTTPGSFNVAVTARDDLSQVDTSFVWTVTGVEPTSSSSRSSGSASVYGITLLFLVALLRVACRPRRLRNA